MAFSRLSEIQVGLLRQQPIDRAAELEQLVDGRFAILFADLPDDLVDEERIDLRVLGLVHPVILDQIAEQPVELAPIAHVLDVVRAA